MDAKEAALRRAATILRGGLTSGPYKGVTMILVADSQLNDVLGLMARAIRPDFVSDPPGPPVRIKGA